MEVFITGRRTERGIISWTRGKWLDWNRRKRGEAGVVTPIHSLPGRGCRSWRARTPCARPSGACGRWSGGMARRAPPPHPSSVANRGRQRRSALCAGWGHKRVTQRAASASASASAPAVEQVRRSGEEKSGHLVGSCLPMGLLDSWILGQPFW